MIRLLPFFVFSVSVQASPTHSNVYKLQQKENVIQNTEPGSLFHVWKDGCKQEVEKNESEGRFCYTCGTKKVCSKFTKTIKYEDVERRRFFKSSDNKIFGYSFIYKCLGCYSSLTLDYFMDEKGDTIFCEKYAGTTIRSSSAEKIEILTKVHLRYDHLPIAARKFTYKKSKKGWRLVSTQDGSILTDLKVKWDGKIVPVAPAPNKAL